MTQAIFWLGGALLGGLIRALVRERRRQLAAASARRDAARLMLDALWAFKTGLDIAIDHKSTAPIDDPRALEEAWRAQQDALESLPRGDRDVVELAVTHAAIAGAAKSSERAFEAQEDAVRGARAEAVTAVDVLRQHLG